MLSPILQRSTINTARSLSVRAMDAGMRGDFRRSVEFYMRAANAYEAAGALRRAEECEAMAATHALRAGFSREDVPAALKRASGRAPTLIQAAKV